MITQPGLSGLLCACSLHDGIVRRCQLHCGFNRHSSFRRVARFVAAIFKFILKPTLNAVMVADGEN